MHSMFVDDMMHAPTNSVTSSSNFTKKIDYTGGGVMEPFLGMEVEQPGKVIKLHLDHDSYVQKVLAKYKAYIKKAFRQKRAPMTPGIVLTNENCPILSDPHKQKYYRSFIAKLQFAASWIRFVTLFTVSTLDRFCASAGPSHWEALHHLMEYHEAFPSFKASSSSPTAGHRGRRLTIWLCGFRQGY